MASLRQKRFDGHIVLAGEEAWLPYQRPPLSKKFLAGELPAERLYFKPPDFYDAADVDVRLETRIASVDRAHRCLLTAAGERIDYDTLVLATGSRVRRIPVPGSDLEAIHYLRCIDDVSRIRADLVDARNVVIIGAGYIGLELGTVAAAQLIEGEARRRSQDVCLEGDLARHRLEAAQQLQSCFIIAVEE